MLTIENIAYFMRRGEATDFVLKLLYEITVEHLCTALWFAMVSISKNTTRITNSLVSGLISYQLQAGYHMLYQDETWENNTMVPSCIWQDMNGKPIHYEIHQESRPFHSHPFAFWSNGFAFGLFLMFRGRKSKKLKQSCGDEFWGFLDWL